MRRANALSALLAAAVAAGGLSACAGLSRGGADREASLLSAASLVPQRDCRVSADPEVLPQAAHLVDAAALGADAARAWGAAGRPAGHVLFTLRYDRHGLNVRRDVIESTVPAALADSLQQLVFAHRREVGPAPAEWGVRLRMDLGDAPELRVGRWEVCAPEPRDRRMIAMLGGGISSEPTGAWDVRERSFTPQVERIWVRVSLDARGMVTDARIERSPLRGMGDARVLSLIRNVPFRPALEDGYAVPSETSIAVGAGPLMGIR